jgi:hypothetical protein
MALHLLERPSSHQPLVQGFTADSEWILAGLTRAGAIAVE